MSSNRTETATTPLTSTTPLPTSNPPTTPTPTTTAPTSTLQTTPTTSIAPVTSVVTASSVPASTQLVTSTVVASTSNGSVMPPSTVVVTVISTPTTTPVTSDTSSRISGTASTSSTSTSSPALNGQGKSSSNSGGLSPAGTIAIAVVIPIVVIAALVFAGLFFWRRRKQQKIAEEERRKEMEAYGYNPNNDPTLPAVGGVVGGSEMMEDDSGYRGWGTATTASNRKASTAISSGLHPSSDGGYHSPGSPNASDQHSGDPLVAGGARRSTMDSETIGALGAAPAATDNIRRGPSNASSSYSMGAHSNGSADAPVPVGGNDYYTDNMYYGGNPYDNSGQGQEAVIRDNPARRNTQIQRNNIYPQQGSSGIAQNF